MERRRFRPFSSGIALTAAATLLSSFVKEPPNDGPCGVETLMYQASTVAEQNNSYGVLPNADCPAEAFHAARLEFTRRHPVPTGLSAVGWHGNAEEMILNEAEREAKTREIASER